MKIKVAATKLATAGLAAALSATLLSGSAPAEPTGYAASTSAAVPAVEAVVEALPEVMYDEAPATAGAFAAAAGSTFSTADLMAVPAGRDVFALNSRPGSQRTIYLDFTGETVTGTAWNSTSTQSIKAPAWSIDADPNTFNATERQAIYTVWNRVSADYQAFDVNVTTQAPAPGVIDRADASDNVYGTRVLITPTTDFGAATCGCGGKSFVGVFNYTSGHARYQPAFVFSRNGLTSAPYLAEAASHEAGHTLGLHHDTTSSGGYYSGSGVWAPIMGNSYGTPVTQFDRGEFSGATNKEDDYAVMAAHGLAYRTKTSTSLATATPLATTAAASGVIVGPQDKDYFVYRHVGGTATFAASPRFAGGNLDIQLAILNAGGQVLATVNPGVAALTSATAAGLDARASLTLGAGTYYAVVSGAGSSGYSSYGSRGEFVITVQQSSTTTTVATKTATPVTASFNFIDIGTSSFRTEINWLAAKGISTGWLMPNGTRQYRPLDSISREAMAAFMYRLAGSPAFTAPARSPFRDVATSHPFYKQITWMAARKITTGYGDGTFRPTGSVTREAMAAFMYRYAKAASGAPASSPFTDVATSSPFFKEIAWMSAQRISTGYADRTYRPALPVTREAMAAFIYRLAN